MSRTAYSMHLTDRQFIVREKTVADPDVIIIGAGIAGLAAACELGDAGRSVCILEARDRIGGRIFAAHDAASGTDIPLGAEFIHGKPAEILRPLRKAGVKIVEVKGKNWCFSGERLCGCDFFSQVDAILEQMNDSLPDESFLDFLDRCCGNAANDPMQEKAKRRAVGYVSGFNAADPALVGVHWLVQEMRAEEALDGERAFRPQGGYGQLVEFFRKRAAGSDVTIRTGTVVERVTWTTGKVEVMANRTGESAKFKAARVLITLPLALLKLPVVEPGAVQFAPPFPDEKLAAMDRLETGSALRIVLRFRERFWDKISPVLGKKKTLSNLGFLFSQDEWFPTWWTTMPDRLPIITGWAPFRAAQRLSGQDESFVIEHSLQTLGTLLGVAPQKLRRRLEQSYFHDWQSDPFSRGAYVYGKVGADGAQAALANPVDNTLFFAGEATDVTGNNGTVHGAIASGHRAAKEILQR